MITPIGLFFAMLAMGPVSGDVIWETGSASDLSFRYTGTPSITLTAADVGSCKLDELFAASLAIMEFNPDPHEIQSTPAIYRTPSQQLRHDAEEIERHDAAVTKWREVMGRCAKVYEEVKRVWKEQYK